MAKEDSNVTTVRGWLRFEVHNDASGLVFVYHSNSDVVLELPLNLNGPLNPATTTVPASGLAFRTITAPDKSFTVSLPAEPAVSDTSDYIGTQSSTRHDLKSKIYFGGQEATYDAIYIDYGGTSLTLAAGLEKAADFSSSGFFTLSTKDIMLGQVPGSETEIRTITTGFKLL